jgi:N-acyl homoserine lactone hydrolase
MQKWLSHIFGQGGSGMTVRMLTAIMGSLALIATPIQASRPMPTVSLWRLDCGLLGKRKISNSCYLVRHGKTYLLWDTGLDSSLANKTDQVVNGRVMTMRDALSQQLKRLGLTPEDVSIIAISHPHYDHVGGAPSFPWARLLIGKRDYEALTTNPLVLTSRPQESLKGLAPWIGTRAPRDLVDGDYDVFGDGSVVMLDTPGHTPGHHSLMVKLRRSGPVLLTGDIYHSIDEYRHGIAPKNVNDPVAAIASDQRIKALVAKTNPLVIIAHEESDIGKLPLFPKPAD